MFGNETMMPLFTIYDFGHDSAFRYTRNFYDF